MTDPAGPAVPPPPHVVVTETSMTPGGFASQRTARSRRLSNMNWCRLFMEPAAPDFSSTGTMRPSTATR